MSQSTNTTSESEEHDLNESSARRDLCDFLAERSELNVRFEEIERGDGEVIERPVARTNSGDKAGVADFPSGKYADDKTANKGNFSKATFTRHRDVATDFLESQDVSDLQEVEPKDVNRWNQHLQRKGYARTTRAGKLQTLEVFFKWAESEFRAPRDDYKLSETLKRKRKDLDVGADEKSRAGDENHIISEERAEEILAREARQNYASRPMVEFLLTLHIGCRASGLLSINVDDVKPRKGIIQIRNRPAKSGVRLKRGNKGERDVNVKSDVMSVVSEYIDHRRKEPKDSSDALLTSSWGRIDESTLYRDITGLTKCGDCTDEEGEALTRQNASDCPESIGPHDLRRTAITRMKNKGIGWDTIAGRVNATVPMLRSHYDSPSFEEDAKRREEEVKRLL